MTLVEELELNVERVTDLDDDSLPPGSKKLGNVAACRLFDAWRMLLLELRALDVVQLGPVEPAMEAALKALQGGPKSG